MDIKIAKTWKCSERHNRIIDVGGMEIQIGYVDHGAGGILNKAVALDGVVIPRILKAINGPDEEAIDKEIVYTLEVEQNDLEVRGNAMASGDDEVDKRAEDEILGRLADGDVWAWAFVKVTAEYRGLTAVDYLGECSYRDEKGFKEPGGYYDDMKAVVRQEIIQLIEKIIT